jgi:UDP-N-acetylmuramate--alanine ligase|tara:strand:+ start:314 stop:1711 length:1398 start_codon:yes stop_codon:yes gene_type:complete
MKISLGKKEIIHFVGIGGIGMSGLALIMKDLGFNVKGTDQQSGKNIERLKKNKINVLIGHKKKHLSNATLLVVSSAIKKNNPEFVEAKKKKIPIYKRGEMLANIVSLYKNVVVSGSHGKTTTTSIVSTIFSRSKLDPTTINGGVINSIGNSAKLGKGEWCVLESDESDGSFLQLPFTYSIITNIDDEHLEHYGSIMQLKKSFIEFAEKTPSFGKTLICLDDRNNKSIINKIKNQNIITYGLSEKSNFRIKNIKLQYNKSIFDLEVNLPNQERKIYKFFKIPLIGIHNIKNCSASIAIAIMMGISVNLIKKAIFEFEGVQRRFNFIFEHQKSIYYDDYAHHPTEIYELLKSTRAVYKSKKIISVFQPHRISRLNSLKKRFTKCFKFSDQVLLCPIYKAGEHLKLKFDYFKFAKEIIKNSKVELIMINNETELAKYVKHNIYGDNIVIGMGAGTITNWIRNLPKLIK